MILKNDGDAMPRVTEGRDYGTVYIYVNFSYPPHLALLYQVDSFHEDPRAYYHPISLYVYGLCLSMFGPCLAPLPN